MNPRTEPCDACATYLQRRRTVLLPFIGRRVVQTGQPPHKLVRRLLDRYHHLNHPAQEVVVPPTSEATKALRRLAAKKRV